MRAAATRAELKHGVWAESNWATRTGRRDSTLLLEFMDEADALLSRVLIELRPNIVFIGAMTLGFPGAVAIAAAVRRLLGNEALIVLGGKHANETLWRRRTGEVVCFANSPLHLMASGKIGEHAGMPLFDIVVSGDAEDVVVRLGELVADVSSLGEPARNAVKAFGSLRSARGSWIAGWLSGNTIATVEGVGLPLPFGEILTAPALYGLQSAFPVFGGTKTGHAYSDMGRGCRYDCFFCSERNRVNGKLRRSPDAIDRLMEHLSAIASEEPTEGKSAFIEDSILLGGDVALIEAFCARKEAQELLALQVGCQLTVSDVLALDSKGHLATLRRAGVNYVAFGMETVNEVVASRMSKNNRKGLWTEANRKALERLTNAGIRAGVFVLWGLGESQLEREHQLQQLAEWKQDYGGQPSAVGLNWATLHPGALHYRSDGLLLWPEIDDWKGARRPAPDYLEWGTPASSELLQPFVEVFGEASEAYPFFFGITPDAAEIERLRAIFRQTLLA